ncbi:acetyl-CoA carboxylase family protein [Gordonia hydrophobica]|uniref:Carboxyl transferase domain-containing protein n=1 Tax=Gordonia hydrophobica TaxID=40516 RepID=A0ABZ2U0K6_9ACTN|nr:carboxyl transferase domain-containing protein [Gordonia hydrophobica]MBM7367728.1 acetyl/propionyl-CoA carboxylase alpha subunit/acetyl-CoA carboxylase carboxyltransferase component [Gordonia hydrophobica]
MKLLIANRGEIALRIIRTARETGVATVAVYAPDDADTPHVAAADEAVALTGTGAAAYLDIDAVLIAARDTGADTVHPGYGFLAENAEFAEACAAAGVTFVGPSPSVLRQFGDKQSARTAAVAAGLDVLAGTDGAADLAQIREFAARTSVGVMLKALAGGGGRGMRPVAPGDDLDAAFRSATAEAELGFGDGRLFAEELLRGARHIEVQVIGDGTRAVALGDRDCSVQRRRQKLIEIAPAPGLPEALRARLHHDAARLCAEAGYAGLATVEFLVDVAADRAVFLEVNPRIQVEHTVTEEVTGVDLVAVGLAIAAGAALDDCGLPAAALAAAPTPAGVAVQARVNLETMSSDGTALPTAGVLEAFSPPTGPGVRVDTFGVPGLETSLRYDSLLAKVIVRAANLDSALVKADRALGEFVIEGPATNIAFLRAVLTDDEFVHGGVDTGYLDRRLADLLPSDDDGGSAALHRDVLTGEITATAPLTATVVEIAPAGAAVAAGEPLVVLEAMKMQHEVLAETAVHIVSTTTSPGRTVSAGAVLLVYREAEAGEVDTTTAVDDIDRRRADLDEVVDRHRMTHDEARPDAVAKRSRLGRRTARENITDLVDADSFIEYGALAIAAQKARRSEADLIANTPADGLVGGVATIGAEVFGRDRAATVVMSYDYTVLAGTQGWRNHAKTDRMLDIALRRDLPVVFFTEGGGGRPGDTDMDIVAGLDVPTFRSMAAIRDRAPSIAVVSGRCFAGNAALAGACDLIVATPDANIGMGGPAMISGGGLGEFPPEAIGPVEVQRRNGVIDLVADDEAHAVRLVQQLLGYFRGATGEWTAPDPRRARHAVPENRLRAYDVHEAITAVADVDSVLELRPEYAPGIVTGFLRVEGRPFGFVANSSLHLGGAIEASGADKLAEFLELCQLRGLPIVSFCDTPGFMVGPESEEQASVRRFSRLFSVGARLTVPLGAVILRKGYGLGAMAMTGGSYHAPQFTVAWPTGEIGGMGLEGAVRLGYSKELAAAPTDDARAELYDQLVATAYARGRGLSAAGTFELDDVIDPADTRRWIATL